jgi:hypothetical protein
LSATPLFDDPTTHRQLEQRLRYQSTIVEIIKFLPDLPLSTPKSNVWLAETRGRVASNAHEKVGEFGAPNAIESRSERSVLFASIPSARIQLLQTARQSRGI